MELMCAIVMKVLILFLCTYTHPAGYFGRSTGLAGTWYISDAGQHSSALLVFFLAVFEFSERMCVVYAGHFSVNTQKTRAHRMAIFIFILVVLL